MIRISAASARKLGLHSVKPTAKALKAASLFPALCAAHGLPEPEPEFKFHPRRKWRWDFAWIAEKVALEIQGALWTQGRHSRGTGYLADNEKANAGVILGWRLLRVSPAEIKSGAVFPLLRRALRLES